MDHKEMKKVIRKYFYLQNNEKIIHWQLYNVAAKPRGKLTALDIYDGKEYTFQNHQLNFYFQKLQKEEKIKPKVYAR